MVAAGNLAVTLQWSARGGKVDAAFIPAVSNSIVVDLLEGGTLLDSVTLVRPTTPPWTSTAHFYAMPSGAFGLKVKAYATTDGAGVVLADGLVAVTVPAGDAGYEKTVAPAIRSSCLWHQRLRGLMFRLRVSR